MRFAVLLNEDLDPLYRKAMYPLKWPVEAKMLKVGYPCPAGYREMTWEELDAHKLQYFAEYNTIYQAYIQETSSSKLRVMDYVAPQFADSHPAQIDFRRHLKPGVVLSKNITFSANGRPQKADYTYEGKHIATIRFDFVVNAMNLMTRRTELLGYVAMNGNIYDWYPIRDQAYDLLSPYYLTEAIKERYDARCTIFDEIKAVLNGFLYQFYTPQGKTYQEVLDIAGQFWAKFASDVDNWQNTGSSNLRINVLADQDFDFMDAPIKPGVTVRQYIISKITY